MIKIEITDEFAGSKITNAAVIGHPVLEQYGIKKLLRQRGIRLNGESVKKDAVLQEGDVLEIFPPIQIESAPLFTVAYEDNDLIALNKKPGVPDLPAKDSPVKDLLTAVTEYMQENGKYSESAGRIPFLCDRIERSAGGLALFAKNAEIFEQIRQGFSQRRVSRVYRAVVIGKPDKETIELSGRYIADERGKLSAAKSAKRGSVSVYTRANLVKSSGEFSVLDLYPITHILNQERAQLAGAGYPIVGDGEYGSVKMNKKLGVKYPILWATRIEFRTGAADMLAYLDETTIDAEEVQFPLIRF